MILTIRLLSAILISSMFLVSCSEDSSNDDGGNGGNGTANPDISVSSFSGVTGDNGLASFVFNAPPGSAGLQTIARSSAGFLRVYSAKSPAGVTLADQNSSRSLSGGLAGQVSPLTFNLPVLAAPFPSGQYEITFQVVNSRGQGAAGIGIEGNFLYKMDSNPNAGTLAVNIALVGPVAESVDVREGLEEAVSIWRTIFNRASIDLDINWFDIAGPAVVPDPREANSFYTQALSGLPKNALNVVIASRVQGANQTNTRFSIPGASPGAALFTERSVVALSLLDVAGNDGRLDFEGRGASQIHNDERRLAGEELAQLAGHYLGLSHTVEFDSGNTRATGADLLSDTESCVTQVDCRESEPTRSNFMFPFPLRKNPDQDERNRRAEYYARDAVTSQQATVMNSHVLVD